jgi:hypothetical protein
MTRPTLPEAEPGDGGTAYASHFEGDSDDTTELCKKLGP